MASFGREVICWVGRPWEAAGAHLHYYGCVCVCDIDVLAGGGHSLRK
jgi:hypothetical protein